MAETPTPIQRIQTLYEHMESSDFEAPMEDDTYRYITVPAKDEDRILKFFRKGYEPAPNHPGNGADVVILKHEKRSYQRKYEEACANLKGYINDISPSTESHKEIAVSSAVVGKEHTEKELVDRLPETDPDKTDDQ